MSNALFPRWKQALLEFTANNDLDGQTVKVALVTAGYTYSSADQYYSSVSASVVGTPRGTTTSPRSTPPWSGAAARRRSRTTRVASAKA